MYKSHSHSHAHRPFVNSLLQLHAHGLGDSQRLSHAEIQHDFFRATGDGIGTNVTVQTLDLGTLAAAGVGQTAKDLTGLTGAELKGDGRLGLETGNGSTKTKHGLGLALEDEVLKPVVGGLDLAGHVGQLHADDGMLDELLAKGLALVGVLDGFFVADAGESQGLDDDAHTLVVEVGHDD
jgi:hypothetical protein